MGVCVAVRKRGVGGRTKKLPRPPGEEQPLSRSSAQNTYIREEDDGAAVNNQKRKTRESEWKKTPT